MNLPPVAYFATGKIQTYVVPAAGCYVIEAAGAQGGPGGGPGGKGARMKGTFFLNRGDVLQIAVGKQGTAGSAEREPAGGGGGGTFVWKAKWSAPLPVKPMLAAGGGGGGSGGDGLVGTDAGAGAGRAGYNGLGGRADVSPDHYSGGGGAGWLCHGQAGSTPTLCGGGMLWEGGAGANHCGNIGGAGGFGGGGGGAYLGHGSGGGGGYSGGGGGTQFGPGGGGGGSFNAGAHQTNVPGVQCGDGYVSIVPVSTLVPPATPETANPFSTLAAKAGAIADA